MHLILAPASVGFYLGHHEPQKPASQPNLNDAYPAECPSILGQKKQIPLPDYSEYMILNEDFLTNTLFPVGVRGI